MKQRTLSTYYNSHIGRSNWNIYCTCFSFTKRSHSQLVNFWEFLHIKFPDHCNLILSSVKKTSPLHGTYIIIKINSSNQLQSLDALLLALRLLFINFLILPKRVKKKLHLIIPTNPKGSASHCPQYIKNLSHERHVAFENIKSLLLCSNINVYLSQFQKFHKICKTIRKIKRMFRFLCYKAQITLICNSFTNRDSHRGWKE